MLQLDLFESLRRAMVPVADRLPDRHPLNDRVSCIVTGLTTGGQEMQVFYDFGERLWRYYGFPQMPPAIAAWR